MNLFKIIYLIFSITTPVGLILWAWPIVVEKFTKKYDKNAWKDCDDFMSNK